MNRGTSLYLDLVRFSAAMMVFSEHLREHTKNGFADFWRLHPYWYTHSNPFSQTAVTVFFVLSGYVIAHVLSTRENTAAIYAASRLGRFYSVALPALILTAVCNWLISLRYPDAFHDFDATGNTSAALHYIGTALFVNRYWIFPNLDVPNTPFWTLSYEGAYYIAIGLYVFLGRHARFIALALFAIIAGPSIAIMSGTWLLGYLTYHATRRWPLPKQYAYFLWLISAILLVLSASLELMFRYHLNFMSTPDHAIGAVLSAYVGALCFSCNLIAASAISPSLERLLGRFHAPIRWLGSLTFALYLFHQPLLSLFTVYSVPDRSSFEQLILLIVGPLFVVGILGTRIESQKAAYKAFFLKLLRRKDTVIAVSD